MGVFLWAFFRTKFKVGKFKVPRTLKSYKKQPTATLNIDPDCYLDYKFDLYFRKL
jgi:hypothetical protein